MGLRATGPMLMPLVGEMRAAELVRLCPGCEAPMDEATPSGGFAVLDCPSCGLSVMLPRERRRSPRL
jgi:hypothetical protein